MKKRTQYSWKLKEESQAFHEWFDNQENISNSLRHIVYHMIELYGTQDILEPSIQRQLVKDSLTLEALKGKSILQVDMQALGVSDFSSNQVTAPGVETIEAVAKKPVKDTKEKVTVKEERVTEKDNSIYGGVDPKNI